MLRYVVLALAVGLAAANTQQQFHPNQEHRNMQNMQQRSGFG